MLKEYIKNHWDDCVRLDRKGDTEEGGTLIGIPYHYIVPSPKNSFQELYYWDTFFTGKGLLLCGREDLLKNCVDNMLYLVNKYGFMPNGNRTTFLSHSQPPFLSMMVRDVYEVFKDEVWLKSAFDVLKVEYNFWETRRNTPVGLNQFRDEFAEEKLDFYHGYAIERTQLTITDRTKHDVAYNLMADCESGWDFNPRTEMHQLDYAWVDLNSNLYVYDTNFAYFSKILNNGEEDYWNKKAEERKEKMHKYMFNGECFMDYNYKTKQTGKVFSVASFYPLWAGVATKEQAVSTIKMLDKLEFDYGIATCEKNDVPGVYQWNYPNAWAPMHYIMIKALLNYGYEDDAKRIANKFITVVEKNFKETENLWEKYNAIDGTLNTASEYGTPVMLGWTAGVYIYCKDLIGNK